MASNIQSDFVVKETAILKWMINNYGNLVLYEVTNSKHFCSSNSECKFRMHFKFDPNARIHLSSNKNDVQIQWRISILDHSGQRQHTKEYRSICNAKNDNCTESVDYATFEECQTITRSAHLRIYCEVDVLEIKNDFPNKTEKVLVEKSYFVGMQELLEKGDLSDVVLVVGGKDFKAHKAILSARSDVFKAMFVTDLEEKKRNRVEITDIEVEVFEHLLLYIYTDTIPELSIEHSVDLFIAADKYNLPYLKATCEQLLATKSEVESAAHVLILADMHNAGQLKAKYIQFINDNSADVRKTEAWKHFTKSSPDLVLELYQDISDKFGKLKVKN